MAADAIDTGVEQHSPGGLEQSLTAPAEPVGCRRRWVRVGRGEPAALPWSGWQSA